MQRKYQKTYKDFVLNAIANIPLTQPIFVADVAKDLSEEYGIDRDKAAAATTVAFKRIMDERKDPSLRRYKKGIYYKTKETAFGECGIKESVLIGRKYLANGNGYETSYSLLNVLGLTTQMPTHLSIASNAVKRSHYDSEFGIQVRPPKTTVTKENRRYLQLLDAIEAMKTAPVDEPHPYRILAEYMKKYNLEFATLLVLAVRHYNSDVLRGIASIAEETEPSCVSRKQGGDGNETP